MTQEKERELKGKLLRLAMYGQCMGDDMEDLKGTRVYKGAIKHHANSLVRSVKQEFGNIVENIHKDADNDQLAQVWSDIEYVIQFVSGMSLGDLRVYVESIKELQNGEK